MQIEKCSYGNTNTNCGLFHSSSNMQISFKLRAANDDIPGAMKAIREAKRAQHLARWAEALLTGGIITAAARDEIAALAKLLADKLIQMGL